GRLAAGGHARQRHRLQSRARHRRGTDRAARRLRRDERPGLRLGSLRQGYRWAFQDQVGLGVPKPGGEPMTSHGEKIGAALAKAVKGTSAAMKERKEPVMYITNLKD